MASGKFWTGSAGPTGRLGYPACAASQRAEVGQEFAGRKTVDMSAVV